MKYSAIFWAAVFCLSSLGCKDSDDKSTDKPADKTADKEAEEPGVPELAKSEDSKLVETDLSSQGDDWKGFWIKAPEGGKVMQDLGNVRVAAGKGFDERFDVIVSQKDPNFEAVKKNMGIGVERSKGTLTFSKDEPDMLEWKAEYPKFTTYGFRKVIEVDGQKIGCWPMHDVNDKSKLDVYREACKSITKK